MDAKTIVAHAQPLFMVDGFVFHERFRGAKSSTLHRLNAVLLPGRELGNGGGRCLQTLNLNSNLKNIPSNPKP